MTNPLNKDSKKFWMVWNQATGHTHQKHYALDDAVDEAKRLGLSKLGQKFVVLESICLIFNSNCSPLYCRPSRILTTHS